MTTKRGKGKITGCLGIRDTYKFYKENYEDVEDYKEFSAIVKELNKELKNQMIFHSEAVTLSHRLGSLQVCKFERSYDLPSNKWAVDWKRTKEAGFKVFHDQKYIYKIAWKKHNAVVKNKTGYKFSSVRGLSRAVPKAVKQHIDYFK